MSNAELLKRYHDQIVDELSGIYLDALNEVTIPAEDVAKQIESSLEEVLSSNYDYFREQYERSKLILEHFTSKKQTYSGVLNVEQDIITGEHYITFPLDVILKTGWKEGDKLEWSSQSDGSYIIRKCSP